MKSEWAIDQMAKCWLPMSDNADEVVAGRALNILLSEGFREIEFDSRDDGSLTLRTGFIELTYEREHAPRGDLQRSTQLLVKAALLAFSNNKPETQS